MKDEMTWEELGFYELERLREDDSVFAVEILGEQTESSAIVWARHYGSLWEAVVRLYRVPGLNLTSDPWPAGARTFCRQYGRNQPLDPHVDLEAEYAAACARLETMDADCAEQTRHREAVHIFAARETVEDLDAMAQGMARGDNNRAASAYSIDAPSAARAGLAEAVAEFSDRPAATIDAPAAREIDNNPRAAGDEQEASRENMGSRLAHQARTNPNSQAQRREWDSGAVQ